MSTNENTEHTLKKSFKPSQAWALALGAVLGWGAFMLPALRFLPQAGPLGAFIGFFIGGLILIPVALCYGNMVSRYPVAGGAFAFAYVGFGPTIAFICGWALVLGYICIVALNVTAISLLSRFMLPGVFEFGFLYSIEGWDVYAGEVGFLVIITLLSGYLNYCGADLAGKIQVVLAFILVTGVILLFLGAYNAPTASMTNLEPLFRYPDKPLTCILAIVAIAPWLYVGFDTIPQAAEEFDFSPSMAAKLMISAILVGAFLYGLVTFSIALVMPYLELLMLTVPWHTGFVAKTALGSLGSIILTFAVLAAIFTGINGFFIATSRLLFSMSRARVLPSWFMAIHPVNKTPYRTIIFTTAFVCIAPFFGRQVLSWVVDMSAVGTVIAYICTSVVCFKSNTPDLPHAGRNKLYGVLGAIGGFTCLLLLTLPMSPAAISKQSWWILFGWVGLGVIFYFAKAKEFTNIPTKQLTEYILGDKDKKVYFSSKK